MKISRKKLFIYVLLGSLLVTLVIVIQSGYRPFAPRVNVYNKQEQSVFNVRVSLGDEVFKLGTLKPNTKGTIWPSKVGDVAAHILFDDALGVACNAEVGEYRAIPQDVFIDIFIEKDDQVASIDYAGSGKLKNSFVVRSKSLTKPSSCSGTVRH